MRKTWRKILAWILIVIMEVSNNGIHALAVSDNGGVNESTNGYGVFDSTVVDECSVSFDLKDQWNDGYKAEVTIENNGAEAIQNWCISMGWNGIIAEIWNAEVCQVTEEGILLKNAGWNQDIEAGASVSFGFRGEGEFPGFPTKYVLWQGSRQISDEDYQFEYEVIDSWKDAFTAEITISNLSEHDAVEDWTIEFDYGGTIENIWNAVILSREGDHYVIQNAGYNGNVLPGQSISFGFNASGEEARPTDVRLRDEKPERGQESVVPVNPGESGEDQEPKPGEQETLWPKVLIDTAGLEIIEGTKEAFTINDSISLGGTLEGADNTKELYLLVLRDDGTEEGRREAEISPAWTIDGVELKIGPNYFVIVAVSKDGAESKDEIVIVRKEAGQQEADLDRNDDDGDGVPNYYEDWLGTRKDLPDTDKDGLSDYNELVFVGTNPNEPDTDNNGIGDAEDDADGDGLSNLQEITRSTNPLDKDTDGDGLWDGREVFVCQTDPLDRDSDDDEVEDGLEIEWGSDPNSYEESFLVTARASEEGGTKVMVEAWLPGKQASSLSVKRADWTEYLTRDVAECVGGFHDFNAEGEIGEAVIKFEIPEELRENPELEFHVCHFNEETQELEPVETYADGSFACARVNHFSLYGLFVVTSPIALNLLIDSFGWQPWTDATPFLKEKNSEIVIVIEDSASMQDNDPSRKRLEVAKRIVDSIPAGCGIGLIRCADKATELTDGLITDKEEIKSYLTEEFFPATGKGGFNSGSRLAYSMLDVDNEEVEKHIIYLIDDSDRGDERPIGTMQYDFKNIKCGICEFLACDFEQLSLESMQNIVAKMALGNHTMFANAKDEESVDAFISKLRKDLVYVDDESDSDDDGLPDLYEECIREYQGKEIRLDKEDEDSDDDYLSDGEEVKGLRHELSKDGKQIRVKVSFNSNPKSEDTDEDGLWDFDEVYLWETNPRKPDTDDDGLDDRIEVDNWFDPLEGDADHDGRLDLQEFAEGTNPRVYNKHGGDYVAAFLKGFMAGDFIRDTQDPTVMAGQLIGSFVPFIDIRDVVANTIHLDAGMTALSLIGLIPAVGDATGSAGKCVKYVSKFADNPSVALELLTFLEKNCPDIAKEVAKSDDFIPAMEKLAKSDLSKLTKAEREALEEFYEKIGLKELIKGGNDVVSWSNHGYKHFPNKNMSWMDIVNSTKSGPAKYSFDIKDVEAFERAAWESGTPVTNGKNWRVNKFETTIGAVNGKETVYVRIENSSNTIHGHPISEAEYYKLLKEH